jgi:hypothetical protein
MLKFPLAGKKGSEFLRVVRQSGDEARIAAAASKACDKFPVPEGQGIC